MNEFYFTETNKSASEVILFLHGGGISSWSWQETADLLPDYHSFLPDLRGHGNNVKLKPFTMENAANDLIGLIENKIGSSVTLVGLSLGSQIALQMVSMRPDLVKRLIISGTLTRPQPGARLLKWFTAPYMPMRNYSFLVKANMRSENLDPRFYAQFAMDTQLLDLENFTDYMSANMSFSLPPSLAQFSNPSLVLSGQKELPVIIHSVRDLLSILPNSTGYLVANQSHGWCINHPDLAAEVMRAFCQKQPLPNSLIRLTI